MTVLQQQKMTEPQPKSKDLAFRVLEERNLDTVPNILANLRTNPFISLELKEFDSFGGFFSKVQANFKAAAELLHKETSEKTAKEPQEGFFIVLTLADHRPYLAKQIISRNSTYQKLGNRKERKNIKLGHDNRIICQSSQVKAVQRLLRKRYPQTPVLFIQDTKKPFLFQGEFFDKIHGKYISQSRKIKELLDLCLSEPKLLINSPTGSGKTHFSINELIPAFEDKYKDSLFVIIATPRNTLNQQVAEEHPNFTNFSSSEKATKVGKFNPQIHKRVVTSLASAPKIVSKIKEVYPYANILLITDEAHALYESFQQIQNFCSLINNQEVKHVIGFTATAHRLMFQDWKIIRFTRTIKPKRNIHFHYTYGDKQLEARHQALALVADSIKKYGYKTAMGFVSGVKEVARLQEHSQQILGDLMGKYDGHVYHFSGESTPKQIKENKFLQRILQKQEPLIGSHFFSTKAVDVGVNVNKLENGDKLDAMFYVSESNHQFLNLITFLQYVSRSRYFDLMDIHVIIPINTTSKQAEKNEFNLEKTFLKTEKLCKLLNKTFYWAVDNRELTPSVMEQSKDLAIKRLDINKIKDTRMKYIWFNTQKREFQVYKEKIYEEVILREAKELAKSEILNSFHDFFDCQVIEQNADWSETRGLDAIKERVDQEEKNALATILELLRTQSDINALATVLYHQTANPKTCEKLAKSFKLIGRSGLLNLNKEEKQKYADLKEKYLEEILLVKTKLIERLLNLHALRLLTNKQKEYSQSIQQIAFFSSRQKVKQTINRLMFFKYNQFVKHNSRAAVFKLLETYDAILKDKTYLYYKSIFKTIKRGLNGKKSIDSTRLLSFVNFHNACLLDTDLKKNFQSEKELIHFLRNFYKISSDVKRKKSFAKGDLVKYSPIKEEAYVEARVIDVLGRGKKAIVHVKFKNDLKQFVIAETLPRYLEKKKEIEFKGFFSSVQEILNEVSPFLFSPSVLGENEAQKTSQVVDNQLFRDTKPSLCSAIYLKSFEQDKVLLVENRTKKRIVFDEKTKKKKKKIMSSKFIDYSSPAFYVKSPYLKQKKEDLINLAKKEENTALLELLTLDLKEQIHFDMKYCYDNNVKLVLDKQEKGFVEGMIHFIGLPSIPNYKKGSLNFQEFCTNRAWIEDKYTYLLDHKDETINKDTKSLKLEDYKQESPVKTFTKGDILAHKNEILENAKTQKDESLIEVLEIDLTNEWHFMIRYCYDNNYKVSLNENETAEMWAFISKNGYGKAPTYTINGISFQEFCSSSLWFQEEKSPTYVALKKQFEENKEWITGFDEFDKFVAYCKRNHIAYSLEFHPQVFSLHAKNGYYDFLQRKKKRKRYSAKTAFSTSTGTIANAEEKLKAQKMEQRRIAEELEKKRKIKDLAKLYAVKPKKTKLQAISPKYGAIKKKTP